MHHAGMHQIERMSRSLRGDHIPGPAANRGLQRNQPFDFIGRGLGDGQALMVLE